MPSVQAVRASKLVAETYCVSDTTTVKDAEQYGAEPVSCTASSCIQRDVFDIPERRQGYAGVSAALLAPLPNPPCHPLDCRPLFLEVSAKVPVGDGLSIFPGATFTYRGGASSLAWVMQSCWRW
jgi:hypothetical protein